MVKRGFERLYLALIFVFLYLPITVLIVLSFNDSKTKVSWGGFTLKWYLRCFHNETIMNAFWTTLQLTIASALIATIIGTLAAIGISSMKRRNKAIFLGATNIPLLNADIVTGLSMMLLFVKFINLGFVTVLIAHITFNIPYVILNVLPKLKTANKYTYEAALDLGASKPFAFYKVTWPEIKSGVFSGFIMAVTMSLDDFSITYFTKGAGMNTISTMLYTELRKGIKPELYALSTILFLTVFILLLAMNIRNEKRSSHGKKPVKNFIACLLVVFCSVTLLGGCAPKKNSTSSKTLTVLNAGKYIDESVITDFEKKTKIKIKYEEYSSPEEMYTKYKSGSIKYDLINTSDYMIEKLIKEGEVQKLDFSNIPHINNIDEEILKLSHSFDPKNEYTVPYFYGTVGILYNKKMVSKEEVSSWKVLWDPKYKNEIIQQNSVRDAFIPALVLNHSSLNTTKKSELKKALKLLKKQYPLTYAYMVDETSDEMISENAAMAVVYSGEAATAMDSNENLSYSLPKEGSNAWVDSWFVPKTCQHKKEAEKFIDYLCTDKVAKKNFDYVWYSSPCKSVQKNLTDDFKKNPALTFNKKTLDKCELFHALSDEDQAYYNKLWQELKSRL
ncbi:MAG: extracellular solute-binding protein [Lachnospiraceae bacterium]|nr:extracellular solute-binding protein [Lachnospiraceae bacterium]